MEVTGPPIYGSNMDQKRHFATTQWSIVRQAGSDDSGVARSALQELCQRYWFPLYSFIRSRGYNASDAEDLTQAFLADLLQREDIPRANPELGRFRSFLLGALKNFLANDRDRKQAQKRGGGKVIFSMDFAAADSRYQIEAPTGQTPELSYERQWAMTLLEHVHKLLRAEHEKRGKVHVFESLKRFLAGKSDESTLGQAAAELGMTEVAVKVAVHRMRGRFGHLLRQEILETVDSESDADDEISSLFEALKN